MKLIQLTPNFHRLIIPVKAGGRVDEFLLSADHHIDNPDSKRKMFLRHLKKCHDNNSMAFFFGDFFCAMQGKFDKRSDKTKILPEHRNGDYFNSLVDWAAEMLMPYRSCIGVISLGNHETAIKNRHEICLTKMLVDKLNACVKEGEHIVYMGGYGGHIQFSYIYDENRRNNKILKYFHGHGGGGEVTKGTIQSQRNAIKYSSADYIVSGHVHESYVISHMHESVNRITGKIKLREQFHVRTPSYKDEYKDGGGGWHVETGKPPKPIGAWELRIEANIGISGIKLKENFLMAR